MTPYEEVKAEFERALGRNRMTPEAEALLEEIYQMTIQPGLVTTPWEDPGRAWVLKQVGKIARKAQAKDPDNPVSRNALAEAANHQIPLASKACRLGPQGTEEVEGADESFGPYCITFAMVPLIL
jgi:hypothetical protein